MPAAETWLAITICFLVLQTVASSVRYCVRGFLLKRLGYDDLASFITLLIAIAFDVITIQLLRTKGLDKPDLLPMDVVLRAGTRATTLTLLYILGTMSLKIATGLLLLRVLHIRWHVITVYVVLALTIIFTIFAFFFTLFQCGNPRQFVIHFLMAECFTARTINALAYSVSVVSAVGHMIFAILPIFYLRSTNLDARTKFSVGGILCLASAGCIFTIARLPWLRYLGNPSYEFFPSIGWCSMMSAIELSIGLTCLALATYKPLFKLRKQQVERASTPAVDENGEAAEDSEIHDWGQLRALDHPERKVVMMWSEYDGTDTMRTNKETNVLPLGLELGWEKDAT